MIRLDNISKQNGHQILFIDASAALNKGEKIGLVGPNGAGKTTLFRMITGQEHPDEGQVAVDGALPSATSARTWARCRAAAPCPR
jgi:ATPase subunit of ABC transporter with duplicated ATPase domains